MVCTVPYVGKLTQLARFFLKIILLPCHCFCILKTWRKMCQSWNLFLQIVWKLPSNIFTTQSQKLQWITFSRLFLYFKDFSMSFFVRQRWVDNRLNYTPTLNMSRLELDTKRMSNVWVPDLYFVNEKKADVHHVTVPNKLMHIYPDGLVVYSMR